MARNVEDIALALDVMSGPAPTDPFSLPARDVPYRDTLDPDLSDWAVAYSPDLGICRVATAVEKTTQNAVAVLEDAGATIEQSTPEFGFGYAELHEVISVLLQDRYLGLYETIRSRYDVDLLDPSNEVTTEVVSRIENATELDPSDIRRAQRRRTTAYDALQSFFTGYDLLAVPTIGREPYEIGETDPEIDGTPVDPNHGWVLTWPFNLTGNPAVSVPAGLVNGLPVGLQLVAPRLSDAAALRAANVYERNHVWAEDYPYRSEII
jgi:Asp-tRNA(Asn)/Glu-tRNA(Gln) amidotransferase A subunit family amidase